MVRSFLTGVVLNLAISNLMIAKIDFETNMLYLAMSRMESMVPVIDEELAKAKEQATLLLNNWNEDTKFQVYFGSFQWPNLFELIKNTEDNLRNALGGGTANRQDIQNATHAAQKLISLMPALREFKDKSGNFERDNPIYDADIRSIVTSDNYMRFQANQASSNLQRGLLGYEKSIDDLLWSFRANPTQMDPDKLKADEKRLFSPLGTTWQNAKSLIRQMALGKKIDSLLEDWSPKVHELKPFGTSPAFSIDTWPNLLKLIKKMNDDLRIALEDKTKDREQAVRAAEKLVKLIDVLGGFQLKVESLRNKNQLYDPLMKDVFEDDSEFVSKIRTAKTESDQALYRYEKSIDDSLAPFIDDLEKIDQSRVDAVEQAAFGSFEKEWQGAREEIRKVIDSDTDDRKKLISIKMDIIRALYRPSLDPLVKKRYLDSLFNFGNFTQLNEEIQREIKSPTFDIRIAMEKYKNEVGARIRALYSRYGVSGEDVTIKAVDDKIDKILGNLKKP